MNISTATETNPQSETLSNAVTQATIDLAINNKTDENPNLYKSLLDIIEPPLLKALMEHCRYNQSRVAQKLGLSRGTLRHKLIEHFGDQYCSTREVATAE